jgi:hypothetical protein
MAFQQLSFRKFSGFRVEFSVSGKSGWIVRKQNFFTGGQDSQEKPSTGFDDGHHISNNKPPILCDLCVLCG